MGRFMNLVMSFGLPLLSSIIGRPHVRIALAITIKMRLGRTHHDLLEHLEAAVRGPLHTPNRRSSDPSSLQAFGNVIQASLLVAYVSFKNA